MTRIEGIAHHGAQAALGLKLAKMDGESVRAQSREALMDNVDELGPVVDTYPMWHPLVCHHHSRYPEVTPSDRCGYKGLDHTRYLTPECLGRSKLAEIRYSNAQLRLGVWNEVAEWLEPTL